MRFARNHLEVIATGDRRLGMSQHWHYCEAIVLRKGLIDGADDRLNGHESVPSDPCLIQGEFDTTPRDVISIERLPTSHVCFSRIPYAIFFPSHVWHLRLLMEKA